MGTPFLGEIKIISWNFAPKGWSFCNGQFLPINQNQALFSLLGTSYGGNGQTTFALPDFRGRVPIHLGSGYIQGQASGQEFHTVIQSEMPQHTHITGASNNADGTNNTNSAANAYPATDPMNAYRTAPNTTLSSLTVTNTGGSQPHENRQPFTVLNFVIALQGVFPSQN
jgi:microcystin-dependent protein